MGSFLYKTRWWYAENVDPDNLLGAGFFAIMYHQNEVTQPTNPTAVSLRLSLSVNDALSEVREVVFPGLFGTGTYTATLAPYEREYEIDEVTSLESFTINTYDRVNNRSERTTYTLIRDENTPETGLNAPATSGLILPLSWWGQDDLSGVATYDIQVRAGEGAWTGWLTDTQRTAAEFVGAEGVSYAFRVRATDQVGNTSEWTTISPSLVQGVTKYYSFNGQRVALRRGTGSGSKVYYLHGDHLGSVSLVTDSAGSTVSESRYAPFGEVRWTRGASLTDFSFTGQRRDGFGLLDFNARFYSPLLSKFISADTIVPEKGNSLAWDRYAYTYNNPLIYIDPSGHFSDKVKGNPRNMDYPSEDPGTVAVCWVPTPEPTVIRSRDEIYGDHSISTNDALLDGPLGRSYGDRAAESYDGYEGSGADPTVPYAGGLELVNLGLEWLRDNTEIGRYPPFNNATVSGEIYYVSNDDGVTFTGASIYNSGKGDIWIQSISANSYWSAADGRNSTWERLFLQSSPREGHASPGMWSYPVSLNNYFIYPNQSAEFTIRVESSINQFANIGAKFSLIR